MCIAASIWRAVTAICVSSLIAVNLSASITAQQTMLVPSRLSIADVALTESLDEPQYPPCPPYYVEYEWWPLEDAGDPVADIGKNSASFDSPTQTHSVHSLGIIVVIIVVVIMCWALEANGKIRAAGTSGEGGKLITQSAGWPSGAKLSVRYFLNGKGMTDVLTPKVNADGTVSAALTFSGVSLKSGDTFTLRALRVVDEHGVSIGGNMVTSPIHIVIPREPLMLFGFASARSRYSKYRTWVSGNAVDETSKSQSCPGPFQFRIQKQKKIIIRRSNGKVYVEVTWKSISKGVYRTNKKAGPWYYRTLNLNKGTYRSVIYGKCGLVGMTTSPVTLKR